MATEYERELSQAANGSRRDRSKSPVSPVSTRASWEQQQASLIEREASPSSIRSLSTTGRRSAEVTHPQETPISQGSMDTYPPTTLLKVPTNTIVEEPTETALNIVPRRPHLIKGWHWEVTCAMISTLSLVGIIVTLFYMEGLLLTRWTEVVRISPNAFISALSTLAKAAIMVPVASCISQMKWLHYDGHVQALYDLDRFDSASRGPWGALTFLCAVRHRALLAAWGSVITLVAFTMGPFTQQLLTFSAQPVALGGVMAPVAQVYDTLMSSNVNGERVMSSKMQGAISSGLYSEDAVPLFDCPSRSCTWSQVQTLAVCNTCVNVTAETQVNAPEDATRSMTALYETPGGFSLNATCGIQMGAPHTQRFISVAAMYNDTTNAAAMDPLLVAFATAKTQSSEQGFVSSLRQDRYDCLDDGKSPNIYRPEVFECSLSLCAKTFLNVSNTNGTVTVDQTADTPLMNANWSWTEPSTEAWLSVFEPAAETSEQHKLTGNTTFSVNQADMRTMKAYLQRFFDTTANVDTSRDDSLLVSNAVAQALWDSQNIANLIDQIAVQMSNVIRNSTNATMTGQGVFYEDQIHIHVQWAWLALPIALVALSVCLLVAAMTVGHSHDAQPWKSSSLPLLFGEFNDSRGEKPLASESLHGMESLAKRTRVSLLRDGSRPVTLEKAPIK